MPEQVVLQLTENPEYVPEKHPNFSGSYPPVPKHDRNPSTPFPRARTLSFSKPKSRFLEQNYYPPPSNSLTREEPCNGDSNPFSPCRETQNPATFDEEEEEPFRDEDIPERRRKKRKFRWRTIAEWICFVIITTCLVSSLTLKLLRHRMVWGLEMWKWCVMVLVMLCGRLLSGWIISFSVLIIERNFMLKSKVLYFVYGLRKSVQNCLWLGLILLAWTLVFNPEVETSSKYRRLLSKVSKFLIAVLVGATIWLVKILLVKVLASSFQVNTFFDRIQESIFHHYVLEMISGPPLDELSGSPCHNPVGLPCRKMGGRKQWKRKDGWGSQKIDPDWLKMLSRENVSVWSMKWLVNYVMDKGLSTISRRVNETIDEFGETESEIKSEFGARAAAERIFKNVAKPGAKAIEVEDLLRFLKEDEVNTIFPLFAGAVDTGKIKKSALRHWVVRAYIERRSLAHSLNDTKTAVNQLHKLASAVVSVVIIVVTLLVMGVATTKVVVLITSQLLLVGFMFGNTCKSIFESIIFVFIMHPFDVGDRCVIDGVQMVVEEMNILNTVFLQCDNEKIYYPNIVLLTKPISNFYRSPDMGDVVEFSVDVATPIESVIALKKHIHEYIKSKPKHWHQKHSIVMEGIEEENKMKMQLCVTHTMNHQNYGEKSNRILDLVFELKKNLEKLNIKYVSLTTKGSPQPCPHCHC